MDEQSVERERAITRVLKSKSNAPAALTQSFVNERTRIVVSTIKHHKLFLLQLVLFSCLSLPLFAQSPRAETVEPALQSLDSKLDVILRRLDAIEKRLGRLEGQRKVPMPSSEAAKQNETNVIPVINWYRPQKLVIPPAVDAGMLIDGIERALKIENCDGIDPLQNLITPNHDGVIFKEPILRHK